MCWAAGKQMADARDQQSHWKQDMVIVINSRVSDDASMQVWLQHLRITSVNTTRAEKRVLWKRELGRQNIRRWSLTYWNICLIENRPLIFVVKLAGCTNHGCCEEQCYCCKKALDTLVTHILLEHLFTLCIHPCAHAPSKVHSMAMTVYWLAKDFCWQTFEIISLLIQR